MAGRPVTFTGLRGREAHRGVDTVDRCARSSSASSTNVIATRSPITTPTMAPRAAIPADSTKPRFANTATSVPATIAPTHPNPPSHQPAKESPALPSLAFEASPHTTHSTMPGGNLKTESTARRIGPSEQRWVGILHGRGSQHEERVGPVLTSGLVARLMTRGAARLHCSEKGT
jgi:hypothetical protein